MTQKKVLIITLGDLKDAIYTLPLLNILKRNDYIVEYLVSEKGFEVINKNPIIDRVHLAPIEQWLKKMPYFGIFDDFNNAVKKIKNRHFDIAFDCEQSFRSLFFLMNSGAEKRITYSDATGFSIFGANEIIKTEYKNLHKVKKYLNFAKYINLNIDSPEFFLPDSNYNSKIKIDKLLNYKEDLPIIVIAPDSINKEYAWHPKNWVSLVGNIPEKYNILVIGDNIVNSLANKMVHKNLINICGKTTFDDTRYILSNANTIITNNIEISSIAWAMNKKNIITISTNLSPEIYSPYSLSDDFTYKNICGNLTCQPCNNLICPNSNYKCIKNPTAETVLKYLY